jgi:hypothetical protein
MPINNNLFGVYKSLRVDGNVVVASSASRNRSMTTTSKNFIQGTPKARILDIGGTKEQITIDAPILLGGGSAVDGRNLANNRLDSLLNPTTATLPILSRAVYTVNQSGGNVSITLESDGDPATNTVFEVRSSEVTELDPIANTPTRQARFYDFRVTIGTRSYYIMEASVTVEANTEEAYFLIPGGTSIDGSGNLTPATSNVGGVTWKLGKQFPFLGINGIKISGKGKAAVVLVDGNTDGDFVDVADSTTNIDLTSGSTDITFQKPGLVVSADANFQLEIADPANSNWIPLLPDTIDLTRSVVTTENFRVETGLLTVDFDFYCWVS